MKPHSALVAGGVCDLTRSHLGLFCLRAVLDRRGEFSYVLRFLVMIVAEAAPVICMRQVGDGVHGMRCATPSLPLDVPGFPVARRSHARCDATVSAGIVSFGHAMGTGWVTAHGYPIA